MKLKYATQLFLSTFTFLLTSCAAQQPADLKYEIGSIPDIVFFEPLTKNEIRLDSLMKKHKAEELQMMLDGKAFIPSVPGSEVKKYITEHREKMKYNYRDNRSRYKLDLFVNDKKDNSQYEGIDTLTTECDCHLSGDTIKVRMGIWVFGGFSFAIDIDKKAFSSTYWEDTHKQMVYKARLTDSVLVDNVRVKNIEERLILEKYPGFSVGENLTGYSKFKTADYYKSEYEGGEKMNTLHLQGEIYFKCKVRKNTDYEE